MSFTSDSRLTGLQGRAFGDYKGTFASPQGQVRADLFACGDILHAYVSFADGYSLESATESWRGPLLQCAEQLGFSSRVTMKFS